MSSALVDTSLSGFIDSFMQISHQLPEPCDRDEVPLHTKIFLYVVVQGPIEKIAIFCRVCTSKFMIPVYKMLDIPSHS